MFKFYLCLFSLLLAGSSSVLAVEQKLSQSWPINHFMLENTQIMLKSVDGAYNFSFPVSERKKPLSAELDIALTNSNLLHERRAQFVVYVNDYVIGQIKLHPDNNTKQVKFVIEKEYLRQGYNQIVFKVAQHYTETQCEDWSAPELWTIVNSEKSTLTLHYENQPIDEKLSVLNTLVNDKLDGYSLSILRPVAQVSDDYLYWGALAAQGIQMRLKYVPMLLDEQQVSPDAAQNAGRFKLDPKQLKHDAILIGTKEQLAPFITENISQAITGAYLGIFQQDQAKQNFILVISGKDNQEVKKAVQSFSLLTARFPDTQQTVIDQTLLREDIPLYPFKSIVPNSTYQFSQLGFEYKPLNAKSSEVSMNIRIPPDLYDTEEKIVRLNLNMAYGAGMRKDSVINISLNNLFNHAILLKDPEGAHYRNYQLSIPLRSFNPGINTLKFSTVLTPSEYGHCAYVQRDNLLVSIYEDSLISFPDVGRGAALPDLQLLARTGFPIIKNGYTDGSVFKLLDNSSDSIAAAWHLIAKLAAHYETPTFDLNITQNAALDNKNTVLVGQISPTNQSALEGSPVKLGALNEYPYQFKEQQQAQSESFLDWINRVVMDRNTEPLTTIIKPESVKIKQTGGLGDRFLLVSYPSPQAKGNIVVALVSEKSNSLRAGVNTLLASSGLWNEVKGNIFSWDTDQKFYRQQEGDTFLTGQGSVRLNMIQYFSKHPWEWLLLTLFVLVLAAWVIQALLSRHKVNTH